MLPMGRTCTNLTIFCRCSISVRVKKIFGSFRATVSAIAFINGAENKKIGVTSNPGKTNLHT